MPTNEYNNLEVIGFSGQIPEERSSPLLIDPIFALKGTDQVLSPPYDEERSSVQTISYTTWQKLCKLWGDSELTVLENRILAGKGKLLFADVGSGKVEYITYTEAFERLKNFSDDHRLLGDNHYRTGNLEKAVEEYGLTSAVSQTAEDYARLLLCNVSEQRQQRLRGFIQQLGENPDDLIKKVKELFESPEADRN